MSELLELTSNGELWRCVEGHTYLVTTDEIPDCPTCAEIKAAEDKRGKEVLELICDRIYEFTDKVSVGAAGLLGDVRNKVRQAYKERYEQG